MGTAMVLSLICFIVAAVLFFLAGFNITRNPPIVMQYIPMGYGFVTVATIIYLFHGLL